MAPHALAARCPDLREFKGDLWWGRGLGENQGGRSNFPVPRSEDSASSVVVD